MSNRIDFRTDTEVLLDHLRDLARDIQKADPAEVHALAGAQLLFLERFQKAQEKANAKARVWLKAKYAEMGTDSDTFERVFPAETNGRLAPPRRTVFPNVAVSGTAAVA